MSRFDMSELEWFFIEPVFLNKVRGVARVDDRRVLNGIFTKFFMLKMRDSRINFKKRRKNTPSNT